jgi:WD40 repeat protein
MGVNALGLIGRVTHSMMGYRDVILVPEKKLFFSVTSDMNAFSRVDSYLTNLSMPWDKGEEQVLLSVGVLEAWVQSKKGVEEYTYERLWCKNFKSQAICIHYNPKLKIVCAGCDNGNLVILRFDIQSPLNYRDIAEEKVHTKRVMGIWSDTKRKLVFSVGEDGFLKVFDITANAVTKEVEVSGAKLTCMITEPKTGLTFIGDKNGTVNVYDLGVVRNFINSVKN